MTKAIRFARRLREKICAKVKLREGKIPKAMFFACLVPKVRVNLQGLRYKVQNP